MKKISFLMGALLIVLGACQHGDAVHGHGREEIAGENDMHHGDHADEIVFPAERAEAAGVVTDTVRPGKFRRVIRTGGQILSAQGDEAVVTAGMNGVVSFARTLLNGTQIARGTVLLTISADKLQDGDPAERARIVYRQAKTAYERARMLADNRIVPQKEVEALEAAYEEARIAYEALSASGTSKGTVATAPMAGFVKSVNVKEGDYVTVGQPLLTLTQNRRLQLRADVSERYYGDLNRMVSANFKTPYDDAVYVLDSLNGRISAYGKAIEGSAHIPVTFEFDNTGTVVSGSFVEVYLLGEEREDVLALPWTAITEEQGAYFVYLRGDTEVYRKREVKLGAGDGQRVEILAGLNGGECVVVRGAYHVKLASASSSIPAHTHSH